MTADAAAECRNEGQTRALWYVAPGAAEIRAAPLPPLGPGDLVVVTRWSAVSRGTERLVFAGLNDDAHRAAMRAPFQEGDFPFPVKYGYCAVGRVEQGPPGLVGRDVFVLHPHQDRFRVPAAQATPVPEAVPIRRATLAANMETALNALWDSGASAGDRIVVVGAGLVGLLVAFLAARLPGTQVSAIDPDPSRAGIAAALGARWQAEPDGRADADVVFHTSATAAGLEAAIGCCGQEARLVEMSWYGDRKVSAGLGGAFHSRRIALLSSQVGSLPAARRPRWDFARRRAMALALLADDRLDALITDEVAFDDLPARLGRILGAGTPGIATVIRY
ncbi:zinc-dependent alcohol dehydrogenase [Xanthobacter pseudotagetidis]|uniref:zinc-dependent alcohol dehydrogenase n=1 Tax=Xanthobacter pseudotagetidis TaxID=3119911 RepID=UPI00372711BA